MTFDLPLREGIFIKRYKRFFADIEWQGKTITAHVANTGSLLGVLEPGVPCRFTYSDDPKRKLKATLQMLKPGGAWVGVNTQIPNRLVLEALEARGLKASTRFSAIKPEFKLSQETRLDFALLDSSGKPVHYIEVKNVSLARKGRALFPDAITTRGQKHMRELSALAKQGASCEILFVVQRDDCSEFGIAEDIDPEYKKEMSKALECGVQVSAYPVTFRSDQIELNADQPLKIYC